MLKIIIPQGSVSQKLRKGKPGHTRMACWKEPKDVTWCGKDRGAWLNKRTLSSICDLPGDRGIASGFRGKRRKRDMAPIDDSINRPVPKGEVEHINRLIGIVDPIRNGNQRCEAIGNLRFGGVQDMVGFIVVEQVGRSAQESLLGARQVLIHQDVLGGEAGLKDKTMFWRDGWYIDRTSRINNQLTEGNRLLA